MRIPYFWRKGIRVTASDLWKDCPILEHLHDPSKGTLKDESFTRYDDDWTLTQATTGAAALSTADHGVLEIDSNSTTTAQGANVQQTGGPFFIPKANTDIWFEAHVKVVDTVDKAELFIGLSAVDTTIIAGGVMTSANHIGFLCVTTDGVMVLSSEKAGTPVASTSTGTTLVEATYVSLGFRVKGVTSIQGYINGVKTGDAIATTYVPIVKIIPSFVCHSDGTNDPILHVAGYRCFQTR